MKSNTFHAYCICGKQQCFSVQTQLCELVTRNSTPGTQGDKAGTTTDVWGQRPISIPFDPTKANYKAWLLFLSFCRRIPGFKEKFIATTFSPPVGSINDAQPLPTTTKTWFVNRIHFPRALLEHRSTYKIFQNQSLLPPPVARRIAEFDGSGRLIEAVNKVSALENFAKQILPPTAFEQFQQCKKQKGVQDYYVQAPVGNFHEAKIHVSSLLRPGKLSLNRKPLEVPKTAATKKRPPAAEVSSSTSSAKKDKMQKHQKHSIDIKSAKVGTHTQTPSPFLHKEKEATSAVPAASPLKNIATIDQCRENIMAANSYTDPNFVWSMKALRVLHNNFDPMRVGTEWVYPCTATQCTSAELGFLSLSKKLRKDHPQLCPDCLLTHQRIKRNKRDRQKRSASLTRRPPITAMSDDEMAVAFKSIKVKVKRCEKVKKRLEKLVSAQVSSKKVSAQDSSKKGPIGLGNVLQAFSAK